MKRYKPEIFYMKYYLEVLLTRIINKIIMLKALLTRIMMLKALKETLNLCNTQYDTQCASLFYLAVLSASLF